jgi:hypothetical protein
VVAPADESDGLEIEQAHPSSAPVFEGDTGAPVERRSDLPALFGHEAAFVSAPLAEGFGEQGDRSVGKWLFLAGIGAAAWWVPSARPERPNGRQEEDEEKDEKDE